MSRALSLPSRVLRLVVRQFFTKPVADSSHGFNPTKVGPELLSQGRDVHVDVSIDDECLIVVDVIEQLIAGQHLAAVGGQAL